MTFLMVMPSVKYRSTALRRSSIENMRTPIRTPKRPTFRPHPRIQKEIYKEWEGFRRSRHCRKNRNLDGEKLIFKIRPRKSERKTKAAKHLLYVFVRKHFRLFQLRSQPVDCNLIGVESAEDTYRQNIFISKDLHDHIAVPGNRF